MGYKREFYELLKEPLRLTAQGPKLGIPQMIQSRAQFGIIGAIFPLVLVIMIYVGFFSTGTVFGAQALSAVFHLPYSLSVVIVNVLAVILVIFGYDFIHRFEKIISILFFWPICSGLFQVFANQYLQKFHFSIYLSWDSFWRQLIDDYWSISYSNCSETVCANGRLSGRCIRFGGYNDYNDYIYHYGPWCFGH